MTLQVQLDSPFLDSLREEAAALGVSLEELAGRILRSHARAKESGRVTASDEAFRAAMAATFDENAELYRRLAQ
jgi:hypothetical protein